MSSRPGTQRLRSWEAARDVACRASRRAWEAIEGLYEAGNVVERKADGPVTAADRLADSVIVEMLEMEHPRDHYGYLTEESENDLTRLERDRVWIIDPIDGTTDFINRTGNFAIHIALVEKIQPELWLPVAAAVAQPTDDAY